MIGHPRCQMAAIALMRAWRRRGSPKDLASHVARHFIMVTWKCDEWLETDEPNKKSKGLDC